ncbi:hypothetical protein BDR07DRAFT_1373198 [Suillus spraguei]|nr:hypothetical protein BDR07DRAFT_1373198 [Suillus spraguei]
MSREHLLLRELSNSPSCLQLSYTWAHPSIFYNHVEIDELDEEQMSIGPAPKMGMPYVEIPPASKSSGKAAGPASGLQEDSHADSTLPVWLPGCGTCVQRQLICHQGYNSSHEQLGVCAHSHRTKHKCGSKGSAAPTKSRRPAVRSKSCQRANTVHVTYKELDKEDELVVRTKIDGEA